MKVVPYPEFTDKVLELVQSGKHIIPDEQWGNYPSSVGNCIRRLYYARTTTLVRNETLKSLGNMILGTVMEDGFREHVLIPAGLFRGRNRFSSRVLRVSGQNDGTILDPVTNQITNLENKSPANPFYSLRDLEDGKLSQDYYYQHQLYIHLGKFKYSIHVVLDRANLFNFKAYKVLPDKKAWEEIKQRIAMLEFAVKKKILPEREYNPFGRADWQCRYCPFGGQVGDGRCVEDPEGTTMQDLGKLLKSKKSKNPTTTSTKGTVTAKKRKPASGKFQI